MKTAAVLSLGLLGSALAAPTTSEAAPNKVRVSRDRHLHGKRADGSVDMEWVLASFRNSIRKYNKTMELPAIMENAVLRRRVKKRDTDANEPLADEVEDTDDELYYGDGTVGKEEQVFTFDFDTGSSDAFVPGPDCGEAEGCTGTTKYAQTGTDEGNTTTITYGSGEVSGENYFDTLTVAGLTATHQNIISLTTATGFSGSDAEGLIGMAFESIAQSEQPPFFFTLIDEGKVDPTEFSFYLGRDKSGTEDNSELTLGGRDSSKYTGDFTSVPVTSQTYWQVALDGATVNGEAVNSLLTEGQAAIDTGTTLIIAPYQAAVAIFADIPGSIPIPLEETLLFAYPCSSSPNVSLTFAGEDFAVNPLDFNFGTVTEFFGLDLGTSQLAELLSGAYCIAGIAGADLDPTENLYVVGDTFLKNWYATFSYVDSSSASVDFAKAV